MPRFRTTTYSPVFVGTCEQYDKIVLYTSIDKPGCLYLKADNGEIWPLEEPAEIELSLDPVLEIQHLKVKSDVWSGEAVGNKLSLIGEESITVLDD